MKSDWIDLIFTRERMKTFLTAIAFSVCSLNAMAHSPFTAPSNYLVNGNNTSILAGFAEQPFDSEVAIRGFEFKVISPKGEVQKLELSNTASLSTANVSSSIDGTYQIIGERSAAIQYAKVGKRWLRVLDAKGENVPPLDVRNFVLPTELTKKHEKFEVQRFDEVLSFFSKYKQSDLQANSAKTGLTFAYSSHPNLVRAGQPFTLTVNLNQKAAIGYQVQLEQQQTDLTKKHEAIKLKTDLQGKVELPLNAVGQYIVTITSPEQKENVKPEPLTYRSILSFYVNP
jgi:hypothetical protein